MGVNENEVHEPIWKIRVELKSIGDARTLCLALNVPDMEDLEYPTEIMLADKYTLPEAIDRILYLGTRSIYAQVFKDYR